MAIKSPLVYDVPADDWERSESCKRVKVGRPGTWSYHHHTIEEIFVARRAGFQIEIDVVEIIIEIISRARHSKAMRSRLLNGRIRCKAVNAVKVGVRTVEYPIPEGLEIVKESE